MALIPALLGLLVGWGGFLGLNEKLSLNRGAGVRTQASLRSEEAFRIANRVAAIPTIAAGGVGLLAGVAALLMPGVVGTLTAVVLGLIGIFALVAGGGVLGHRAAEAVPAPVSTASPATVSCGGCACGEGGCGTAFPAG